MSKPPVNAADETQVEQARKKDKQGRERDLDDLKHVLDTRQGRRFVWRQLVAAGLFRTSYTGSSNQTCFNEGQRNGGLMLLNDIHEAAPEAYLQMLQESKE